MALAAVAWAAVAACASMGAPTGGPKDKKPPVLLSVSPDTGARRAKVKDVVFTFDEVVSERPKTAPTLDQIVVVSPSDGLPVVDWQRTKLAVHPKKGWRPNTAYTVTLLPGLSDLSNNDIKKALFTVFSTGDSIPRGVVRGVVFDWIGQKVIAGARIEAMLGADTTLVWLTASDSLGRFALPQTPPSEDLRVRAYFDQNRNRQKDRNEPWDTATLTLTDSARRDFYVFSHDSIPPKMSDITLVDSTALRIKFDRPINPASPLVVSQFVLLNKDSSVRALRALYPSSRFDSLAVIAKKERDDSLAKADTTKATRTARAKADSLRAVVVRDSIAQAQIDAVKASRDTVKREPAPKPARPAPVSDYVLQLVAPLKIGDTVRVHLTGAIALDGTVRKTDSKMVYRPKPAPKDTSKRAGTPGAKPGATSPAASAAGAAKKTAADSSAAKKPIADSTAVKNAAIDSSAVKKAALDSTALKKAVADSLAAKKPAVPPNAVKPPESHTP